MSSKGQAVGGIVGAVVGYFVGNPVMGAQIGMTIGGLLDPPKVQGPRLSDLIAQTSTYGVFIPRDYGTVAHTGNVFWIQGDRLIEREAEDSGKGGPEVTNYEYFATFAVGLCEGPIAGIRRIWVGGQLWYDAGASDLASIIASNEVAAGFTLYTGSETQLADPLIQADRGVANVPAYRGLAYIVFDAMPLQEYGNSLSGAQVKVEICKAATYTNILADSLNIAAEPIWFTSYRASGNQYDNYGFANYIAASLTQKYPIWVRAIGGRYSASSLTGPSDLPFFVRANAQVGGLQTSLDTLHYAFLVEFQYLVWGRDGGLSYWDSEATLSTMYALAEMGGVVYVVVGSSIAKMDTSPGGAKRQLSSSLNLAGETPVLSVWGTSAVTASKSSGDQILKIGVYDEVLVDMVKTLVKTDSYTLTLPGTTPVATYAITYQDASCYVENDILYIVMVASTDATTPRTTVIKVDLLTKSILSETVIVYSIGALTSPRQPNVRVVNSLIYYGQMNDNETYTLVRNVWSIPGKIASSAAVLGDIVQAECLKSELLTAADIDVTELTDTVRGYRIGNISPIRGGIDTLRKAWPFDVVQAGYKIKFKKRGGASVSTITDAELDAREAGAEPGVQVTNTREMDTLMSSQLTVQYLDFTREYDVNVAEESR